MHPLSSHQRQVHLDFHTSPFIRGVASEFDAAEFARTMKRASVNSVTLFAKCHHGYTYFPSKVRESHPYLVPRNRDLLGEQIAALHREGIRCPIYITVGWDELSAQINPEWRARNADGEFANWHAGQPGPWKFLNWLHPLYQDHIEAITREVLARYGSEVDGFFYDICFFPEGACWSDESLKFRKRHGLEDDSCAGRKRFIAKAGESFSARFSRVIQGISPRATIFYNAACDVFVEPGLGVRTRYENMTHMEIESLPSGEWGYWHFPRAARALAHWGKPWLGMTGRFQTMWGDFGGIKPQPALEFECFRAQALGGANSIGDQLLPSGRPDPAAYDLIGAVYEKVAEAEPFYEGSSSIADVGVVTSGSAHGVSEQSAKSDEGAVQMCEEAHYDCCVLDGISPLENLAAVVLTDGTTLTPEYVQRLRQYYEAGGKLIVSHKGGCDASGKWVLDFIPLAIEDELADYPAYWRASVEFSPALARTDRVFYSQGLVVSTLRPLEVLAERVLPYFKRTALHFCSHLQTPPRLESSGQPVVIAGDRFIYFADPIFGEYRVSGNILARDAFKLAMQRLIGPPAFGDALATTIQCYPRRKGNDLLITLLHFIPIRKALQIDMIEERGSFAGQILKLGKSVDSVRVFETGECLARVDEKCWELPVKSSGRLLLRITNYFSE